MTAPNRAIVVALTALFAIGAGFFASRATTARADTPAASVTVFVDATLGFRKDHLARQLTKSHAKFEALGYHFADMEAYDENGDLQGFFVTYSRN
jgi:hypothetical protein